MRRCQLLNDVGCALVYLHSLDPIVVHGDIKGDNVLVAGPPDHVQAKPTDFGLSRVLDPKSRQLGRHCGMDGTQSCQSPLKPGGRHHLQTSFLSGI